MMPSRSCAFSTPTCSSTIRSRAALAPELGFAICRDAGLFVLRLQRREVGACCQQIVYPESGHDGGHERSPGAVAVAALHVVELSHEVARRTSRECRHRAQSAQIAAVANRARGDLAAVGCRPAHDEGLALLEADGRDIGNEARSRVAAGLGAMRALAQFVDVMP